MLRIAVDTNAYSELKRGDGHILSLLNHADDVLVSSVVLGELLAGFAGGTREARNRLELTQFLESPGVRLVECGAATADRYALVHLALRRRGRPIPTNDAWIAASCLEHGAALLTLDAHFADIGALRVGRRLEDFIP